MPEEKRNILLLFKEIQGGNKTAFDTLFALYYDKLLSFARQYVKQLELAEEITSELFVKIWLRRDQLGKVLYPEVYLYISIKNACLNLIRRDKKRQLLFTEQPMEPSAGQLANDHGIRLEDKELMQLLDLAIAALPTQRQMVFRLIKEQGLKSNVVAQILGISVRTVENQLYKAIKTLATQISGYLGYHPQVQLSKKQALAELPLLFFI